MELCLAHGREVHNLSVERVADRMGVPSHWALYKWMENGRMPALLIRPFEAATGADYVTRWLAASDHKVLVDIPTGRAATEMSTAELQAAMAESIRLLLGYYADGGDPAKVLDAVRGAIAGLGWHHANVERSIEPELDMESGE